MHSLLPVIISAGVTGVVVAVLSPTLGRAIMMLARARGLHVKHVPVSGTDLYNNGVPLTEQQFREAFGAMQAELDELPAQRTEWDMKRQFAAVNRLSMLAGTFPHAFPMLGNADDAWNWYEANNPYATRDLPSVHGFAIEAPGVIRQPWRRVTRGSQPPAI